MRSTPSSAIGSAASTCRPGRSARTRPMRPAARSQPGCSRAPSPARPRHPRSSDSRTGDRHRGRRRHQSRTGDRATIAPKTAVLDERQQTKDRQRVDAPEDRGRRRRGVREADENARERDRDRAEERADPHVGLGLEPVQHSPSSLRFMCGGARTSRAIPGTPQIGCGTFRMTRGSPCSTFPA